MFENGCAWVRADFHLHTMSDKEFSYKGEHFITDYVDALDKNEIRVAAITNHNKFNFEEYRNLKKYAKRKDIYILPGVELSVKEGANGVHTLIIFNPEEWLFQGNDHIGSFLDSVFLGINNRENENVTCNYGILQVLQILESVGKDYFIVFAHIEQSSGIINECKGGLLASLADHKEFRKRVLGLQKLRKRDNISKIKNWFKYDLALVEGSDPKSINDIGKGQTTYLKIGEYSFATVKYALQDFSNRISPQIPVVKHGYIESASFYGGKLNGQTVPFSSELNTFIGIRGSGKSSILESIRYALNLEPLKYSDVDYKLNLVKNTLGSGGQISLKVHDGYGKVYEIRRICNEPISILNEDCQDLGVSIGTLINNPLYFGQKDLSSLKSGLELDLLDKLIGNKFPNKNDTLISHNNSIVKKLELLLNIREIPEKLDELRTNLKDVKYKLKFYEEKGLDAKLSKQTSFNGDLITVDNLISDIEKITEKYQKVSSCNTLDSGRINIISLSAYNSDKGIAINNLIDSINSNYTEIERILDLIKSDTQELKGLRTSLFADIQSLSAEFAEIKRDINDDELDPDSYVNYKKKEYGINRDIEELNKQNQNRPAYLIDINSEIRKRNETLLEIYNNYKAEIDRINSSQSELKLRIEFKGNKQKFIKDLKEQFRGTGLSQIKIELIANKFTDFANIIQDVFIDDGKILKQIVTVNEYAKVYDKVIQNYRNLITIECPNLVEIEYHGKPLAQHSLGQRASALILFIITQQENDLIIIDQPEDDLDNQVIYKEVIQTLKKNKPNIQFIFATHNPNIPVLGDSETVIATEYDEDKITLSIGNIDAAVTHKKIVDIMEGGNEAFERRKRIYSSWEQGC